MEQRNGIEAALPMDEQAQVTASLWWFILRVSLTTGCHIKQFLRIFLEEMSIWTAGLQKVDRPPWRWCPLYSIKGLNRTKFRGGRNLPLFPCLTELRHLSTSLAFQLRLLQWLPGFTDLPAQTGLLFFPGSAACRWRIMGLSLHDEVTQFLDISLLVLFPWRILTNTRIYVLTYMIVRSQLEEAVNHGKRRWLWE